MSTKPFLYFTLFLFTIFNSGIHPQNQKNHNFNSHTEAAEALIRTALTDMTGYKWLQALCEIGPRLSGSENSLKAINWAKQKMELAGFDSVWLQPVMVPKWERGKNESALISSSTKFKGKKIAVASLGGSIATQKQGLTAGVVEVQSIDQLKKLGKTVKGMIVFYNRPFDNGLVSTFEGYSKAVDQRSIGTIEAAKLGAAGAIVRSITSKNDNIPHVGIINHADDVTKIPAVAIGVQDANFLSSALKEENDLRVTIKIDPKNHGEVESFNVIGEIKGDELPNEVIVVGGHFDSWDKGCGAHDDGAPSIQTMEVLHLFKKLGIKPKRTIRCVLFINEENGLRGGIEYGKYAASSSEIHVAAIESDRGAFTPRGFNLDADSLIIERVQRWLPILNKSKIEWIKKGGSGADISQIKNAKALIGFVPDDQRYFDLHHSANDTFDTVHPREMELGTAAIAILTYLISEEGL